MYSRTLGERTLEFGHEGVLFKNSFIMYDRQTNSLWVHTTGQAIKGPLKGKQLEFLPSQVIPWGDWREAHPQTKVLLGDKAQGFMGRFGAADAPENYGLSIGAGPKAKLYPYAALQKERMVQDRYDDRSLVIVYDQERHLATAFSAQLDEQVLAFKLVESDGDLALQDRKSGSLFNPGTGQCIKGKLKGKRLRPVVATAWLIERWKGFYPDGEIYAATKPKRRGYR